MARAGQALTTRTGQIRTRAEILRERIRAGQIVTRLQKCALGEIEMTATQIQAARLLINKVLPDERPERTGDPLAGAKDITHANPHDLLTVIEGQAERQE